MRYPSYIQNLRYGKIISAILVVPLLARQLLKTDAYNWDSEAWDVYLGCHVSKAGKQSKGPSLKAPTFDQGLLSNLQSSQRLQTAHL